MATEIADNGSSLKVTTDGVTRYIIKSQIKEVVVVRDTIIKLDIGQGALYNEFFDQTAVDAPQSKGVEDLRDQIMGMLQITVAGGATAQKQDDQRAQIVGLQASLIDLQGKIGALSDKVRVEPQIVDETNPNTVYRGFAAPGAKTSDAVWGVQRITNTRGVLAFMWAGGSKALANIWDNRKTLVYS
jgi:hypothetical protein